MTRYIDAKQLYKGITDGEYTTGNIFKDMALLEFIKAQPTVDAVEVVRCKDCRFNVANMETNPLDATDYSDITCSYFMTDGMEPDGFCGRGAKMDGKKVD